MYQLILVYQLGEKGKAVGIDHVKGLVEMSIANIQQDQPDLLSSNRVELVGNSFYDFDDEWCKILYDIFPVGDGRKGFEEEGPYDAIHVGAAAPTLPEAVGIAFSKISFRRFCVFLCISLHIFEYVVVFRRLTKALFHPSVNGTVKTWRTTGYPGGSWRWTSISGTDWSE